METTARTAAVIFSAASLLALGACSTGTHTYPPPPKPPPAVTAPAVPAPPPPAPVVPAGPAQHHHTSTNKPDTGSTHSTSPSKHSSTNSGESSSTGKSSSTSGKSSTKLPDYKRCGVTCGEEATSGDIQSGRAAPSYPTSGGTDNGGAGSESTRQWQQEQQSGHTAGHTSSTCDETCARGN